MRRLVLFILLVVLPVIPACAYKIIYAEQFYRLYHERFYMYPEDYLYSIKILEEALDADFANPLNALSREIETPVQHERYRYLFSMHVNLELTRMYRALGAGYDKRKAYYFNAPWRDMTLNSLRYAESYYEAALYYWEQALEWSHKAWRMRRIELTDLASWQDDNYRIETGDLDYYEIVSNDLARLRSVRAEFEAMDENTY
jgi:hypothetical protein